MQATPLFVGMSDLISQAVPAPSSPAVGKHFLERLIDDASESLETQQIEGTIVTSQMKGKQTQSGSGDAGELTMGKPSTSNPGQKQVLDSVPESNFRLWTWLLEAREEIRALKVELEQTDNAAAERSTMVRSQADSIETLRFEKVRQQTLDQAQGKSLSIIKFSRTWRLR